MMLYMTRKFDGYGQPTEFSNWLRSNKQLDSKLGFVTTNIDFLWQNYKTGQWMLIEEKRHGASLKYAQRKMLELLHKACLGATGYCGTHLIQFENTSPEDGQIFLNKTEITKQQLTDFLQFKVSYEDIKTLHLTMQE